MVCIDPAKTSAVHAIARTRHDPPLVVRNKRYLTFVTIRFQHDRVFVLLEKFEIGTIGALRIGNGLLAGHECNARQQKE